jgi:hypothetical protein
MCLDFANNPVRQLVASAYAALRLEDGSGWVSLTILAAELTGGCRDIGSQGDARLAARSSGNVAR